MNNFDKNWRSAKKSIFRLEGRPEYQVPGRQVHLENWKQGKLDLSCDKIWRGWLAALKTVQAKGITPQRVRVAPKMMPENIKFEVALWQEYSAKKGEKLYSLDIDRYQSIIAASGFDPKDFWLFDDEKLLMFNYGKAGQFAGEILITSGSMVKRYCDLKYKLLQSSVMLKTAGKNGETPSVYRAVSLNTV